jgi:prephenate dehydrogenase
MDEESNFGYKRITIIGLGLIGGSLGLSLKLNNPSLKITGIDKKVIIKKALTCGAIDQGTTDLQEGIKNADIVIIATPVKVILSLLAKIKPFLKGGCLITDTGSTKTDIMSRAEKLFSDKSDKIDFIGGHPMAGLEKGGIDCARADLFKNKPYLVIPAEKKGVSAHLKLSHLINSIGAKEIIIGFEEHDEAVALISHLPHLIAVIMTNMFGFWVAKRNREDYFKVGENFFQEMTRVATSPFNIWSDIFETNSKNIVYFLEALEKGLASSKTKIVSDPKQLKVDFASAKFFKEKMLEIKKD